MHGAAKQIHEKGIIFGGHKKFRYAGVGGTASLYDL
jgi:hypothetical protein